MLTTWFDGALLRVRKQTANFQPFFSVAPYALKVLWSEGTLAAWPQPGTSLFVPFSEGKIGRTVLLFPLVTSYAASHAGDAADSGHTGPIKNGDAFERLGL